MVRNIFKRFFSVTPLSIYVSWIFFIFKRLSLAIRSSERFVFAITGAMLSIFRDTFQNIKGFFTFLANNTYSFSCIKSMKAVFSTEFISIVFRGNFKRFRTVFTNLIQSLFNTRFCVTQTRAIFLSFVIPRNFFITIGTNSHGFSISDIHSPTKTILIPGGINA